MLEDLKQRPLRIPLPELTEKEREELGDRANSYESRLRYHYLRPQKHPAVRVVVVVAVLEEAKVVELVQSDRPAAAQLEAMQRAAVLQNQDETFLATPMKT